ncbi:MAG: glycosyltransferase, partial [Deltaproteobacteria bacterium]|nr:glycosyltransferase [Deltaproteobacteria bacterium]
ELLQSFDIGLMPLEDTPYTRGKGGFKLLQYMACGVVPVASAVGMNKEIITHGRDGFLVRKGESWKPYVESLLNSELRAKMGEEARKTVCTRFDLQKIVDPVYAVLLERFHQRKERHI